MKRLILCIAAAVSGFGCTSDRLKYSVVDQAGTLNKLQYEQVLNNLAMSRVARDIIPSQVNLRDGSAQVSDFGAASALLDIHRAWTTHPSLAGQRTIVEQWGLTPLTDDTEMKLVMLAYRRANGSGEELGGELANEIAHELKKQIALSDDADVVEGKRGAQGRLDELNKIQALIDLPSGLYPKRAAGFDLQLMSNVSGVSDIPTSGRDLVIIAEVNGVLYFRMFDADGKITDTNEMQLTTQAGPIADLKAQLGILWPPHGLTRQEKARVLQAATSIVDYSQAANNSREEGNVPVNGLVNQAKDLLDKTYNFSDNGIKFLFDAEQSARDAAAAREKARGAAAAARSAAAAAAEQREPEQKNRLEKEARDASQLAADLDENARVLEQADWNNQQMALDYFDKSDKLFNKLQLIQLRVKGLNDLTDKLADQVRGNSRVTDSIEMKSRLAEALERRNINNKDIFLTKEQQALLIAEDETITANDEDIITKWDYNSKNIYEIPVDYSFVPYNGKWRYQNTTVLVKELRRRVKEIAKDVHNIKSGWFGFGHSPPENACYVGRYRDCLGRDCYTWVCRGGEKQLSDFTLTILNFSTLLKDSQVVTVPGGGPRYFPSSGGPAGSGRIF